MAYQRKGFIEPISAQLPRGSTKQLDELLKPLENRSDIIREAIRREVERRLQQRKRYKTTDMEAAE